MKLHLMHAFNIKRFDDVARHLELEMNCLEAIKIKSEAYVAKFGC